MREKRDNHCDYLPGEEFIHETNIQMATRISKLKQILWELTKQYKKILVVGHCQTFMYFLATNTDEIMKDTTDTVLPNGPHLKYCEQVEYDLQENGF